MCSPQISSAAARIAGSTVSRVAFINNSANHSKTFWICCGFGFCRSSGANGTPMSLIHPAISRSGYNSQRLTIRSHKVMRQTKRMNASLSFCCCFPFPPLPCPWARNCWLILYDSMLVHRRIRAPRFQSRLLKSYRHKAVCLGARNDRVF